MKQDLFSDIEKLYDQTFKFFEEEGLVETPLTPGPSQAEYPKAFRIQPEKYLLKDNLLLLLKDI
jgi:hypothetical protein